MRLKHFQKELVLLQGSSDPEKVFDRTANLENTQIINYRVDPQEKWCVLVGIAPGAPERYDLCMIAMLWFCFLLGRE